MYGLNADIRKALEDMGVTTLQEAREKEINITGVLVSTALRQKILRYINENSLNTYSRYGKGGRSGGATQYTYTLHFKYSNSNFWFKSGGSSAHVGSEGNLAKAKERTPTLEQLFFNAIKKYPSDVIKVTWYFEADSI